MDGNPLALVNSVSKCDETTELPGYYFKEWVLFIFGQNCSH